MHNEHSYQVCRPFTCHRESSHFLPDTFAWWFLNSQYSLGRGISPNKITWRWEFSCRWSVCLQVILTAGDTSPKQNPKTDITFQLYLWNVIDTDLLTTLYCKDTFTHWQLVCFDFITFNNILRLNCGIHIRALDIIFTCMFCKYVIVCLSRPWKAYQMSCCADR